MFYFVSQEKHELESLRKEQVAAVKEGWFENIAIVVFGIADMTKEENEILEGRNCISSLCTIPDILN